MSTLKEWDEVRRRKCECGASLSIKVNMERRQPIVIPTKPPMDIICGISVSVEGEPTSVELFGKYTYRQKRTIRSYRTMFVFCGSCNRRHQVGKFQP